MCGIVGVLGKGPVAELLVDALKRLEYRGYDSAGVATLENGQIGRRRAEGKLRNLEELLKVEPLHGTSGIGHTRWATHGKPVEANAHPHMTDDVAVVHNGIIENFRELKAQLVAEGAPFSSDTDTEVIAHLITRELRAGKDPVAAVYQTLAHLQGAFALAMIFRGYMATARCSWAPTPSRSRRSPTRLPIWRTATGRSSPAKASPYTTGKASRSSVRSRNRWPRG
jgi:glucosamine--fructose-6-phosphate aminotransferase (isomerizing)